MRRVTVLPGSLATRLRLVVFPHAGGGASAYRPLRAVLPDDVALCLVHPAGREGRAAEPAPRTLAAVVADLAPAVAEVAREGPYVLFGHSMGAVVAHDVAHALVARGCPPPVRLVASASRAPHAAGASSLHEAPDEALVEALRRLGGTPPEVLAHPELMAMVLPAFRADLEALARRERPDASPATPSTAPCPVTVMGGDRDATVPVEDLDSWRALGNVDVHVFAGGHFYLAEDPEATRFLASLL